MTRGDTFQFARWQCPDSTSESKKLLTCEASADDRRSSPSSMFLTCAASVKFAEETNSSRLSPTTHFACKTARRFGSDSKRRSQNRPHGGRLRPLVAEQN